MQSAMILKLCMHCYLKWLRMMKLLIQMLPIQMMKSPPKSLFQKILTTKPILTHKIGLVIMKKMLRTWLEINVWLACTKAKMLQKLWIVSRQPNGTLICLKSKAPISATTPRYYFKIAIPFLLTKMTLVTFQAKMLHALDHATLFSHTSDTICSQDKLIMLFAMPPCFSHASDTLCS